MCCCSGQEPSEIIHTYREKFSEDAVDEVFVPTYAKMKRYQGEWHVEQGILFPGYVFLESKDTDALLSEMKNVDALEHPMICLLPEQEAFLCKVLGKEKHLGLSKGYIKDGCTYVTQGPLQGKEKMIRRIDRHKRLAKLEIPVGDDKKEMYAGLEIVSKS